MIFASFITFFTDLLDPSKLGEILDSVSPWQYVVLFVIIFAESGLLIGLFLPGDSLLFSAGILASSGKLNIWILLPLSFAAAFTGDQTGYFVGSKLGTKMFSKEDAKILKKSHIEKTSVFFDKHGPKTILLGDVIGEDKIDKFLLPIIAFIIFLSFLPPLFEYIKHRKAKSSAV